MASSGVGRGLLYIRTIDIFVDCEGGAVSICMRKS